VVVIPKNQNRLWLLGRGPRMRAAVGRWPGLFPGGFSPFRSELAGRIARGRDAPNPFAIACVWLAETVLERWLLGFPWSVLRRVARALPCSASAQALRRIVRAAQAWQARA